MAPGSGCQQENAPTSRLTTRWSAGGGRSEGASRKGHQRVAMTRWWLYGSGARWKVHQRFYNDSLVLEVAGRESKTGQRVAMTHWQLCGSGAKRKTHQRVVKRLVGARKGREVAGEWVCGSGSKRKTHQRVVKRLVGGRKGREEAGEWVPAHNESLKGREVAEVVHLIP